MQPQDIQSVDAEGNVTIQPPLPTPIVTTISDLTDARDKAESAMEKAQKDVDWYSGVLSTAQDALDAAQALLDAAVAKQSS